jgi:dUTP pyrophosphatase
MEITAPEVLACKLLSADATLPTRMTAGAAGYDIYSSENTTIAAQSIGVIATKIAIAVPAGYYGRIAPRSSLAVRHLISVGGGVVDSDYRGEIGIVLFNHSQNKDAAFVVHKGDRIAQLIIERIATPTIVKVDELPGTVRGSGGFGSTGK